MFNRILVPLDGSPLAERVIPHAEQFARIFGSEIILLQVLDPTSFHENPNPVDPLNWQIRKAEADMYMEEIATRMRANLGNKPGGGGDTEKYQARVQYAIREGKTAENIVNFAHTENIDLLIISTHGAGGLSRWNISSITEKVINLSYLPILVVRAHQPEIKAASIFYRRILLPLDGSRRAECSLPAGVALAQGEISMGFPPEVNNLSVETSTSGIPSTHSKLFLITVIKPPELPISYPYPIEIQQLVDQLMEVTRLVVNQYMNEMKARLSVQCETCVVENNSISTAIQTLTNQKEDIDLVVMCAHGATGHSTRPYGSVARDYLEHGEKDVLVIQDLIRSKITPSPSEISFEKHEGR